MLIFFHIPKNGGTNMKSIIDKIDQHDKITYATHFKDLLNYNPYKKILKDNNPIEYRIFNKFIENNLNYKSFTLIRNPFYRCLSTYKWIFAKYEDNGIDLVPERRRICIINNSPIILDKNTSFLKFVKLIPDILKSKTDKYNNLKWHLQPQFNLIVDKNKKIDYIFKLENFDNEIRSLFSNFELEFPDLHTKRNKSIDTKLDYFNKEIIDIIKSVYYNDFILLNYDIHELD